MITRRKPRTTFRSRVAQNGFVPVLSIGQVIDPKAVRRPRRLAWNLLFKVGLSRVRQRGTPARKRLRRIYFETSH